MTNNLAGIISLCRKKPRVGAITVFTTTCLAPLIFSFIALGVGAVYMDAVEIPFEYLGREEEKNMVYYYKVYRIGTVYKRYGQKIENRLKLFEEPYAAQNSGKNPKPDPMVEPAGPFKKWRWAFALFNHI